MARPWSEVLGAEALTIADARVTDHHEFSSISVTAERWLPIHEVALSGLKSYLARLRDEGYSLIGGVSVGRREGVWFGGKSYTS